MNFGGKSYIDEMKTMNLTELKKRGEAIRAWEATGPINPEMKAKWEDAVRSIGLNEKTTWEALSPASLGGISIQSPSNGIIKAKTENRPYLTSPNYRSIEKIDCSNSESLNLNHLRRMARSFNVNFLNSDGTAELCEHVNKATSEISRKYLELRRKELINTDSTPTFNKNQRTGVITSRESINGYSAIPVEEFKKHQCLNLFKSKWNDRELLRETARTLNIDFQDSDRFVDLCEHMKKTLATREEKKIYSNRDGYPAIPIEEFNKYSCSNLLESKWSNREHLRQTARELGISFPYSYEYDKLCRHVKKILTAREEDEKLSIPPINQYDD